MPWFLILNIQGFWICLGFTRFWIWPNNFWTCLNILKYVWMCLNLFAVCFCFTSSCNPLFTWMCGYLFRCLYETRSYSLEEYEAVFLQRQNLIFPTVGESIWFVCCFTLNFFTRFLITLFKACVRYFHQIFIFSRNDSPSKTMKNAFLFHLKKLFLFSRYSIFCISVLPSFSTCQPLLWRMIEDKS